MGLDITAYRKLTRAPDAEVDECGAPKEWEKFAHLHPSTMAWVEENFPGRAQGVQPGIYSFADKFGFRAGSYSGYGQWRDWLAKVAGYAGERAAWSASSGPFWELINFADNEGVIGPVVSAKLAKDFADNEQRIADQSPEPWFIDQYRIWRKAFEMAADAGAVDFH